MASSSQQIAVCDNCLQHHLKTYYNNAGVVSNKTITVVHPVEKNSKAHTPIERVLSLKLLLLDEIGFRCCLWQQSLHTLQQLGQGNF